MKKKWQTSEEKTCREKRFKISFILYANFPTKNILNIKVILRSQKNKCVVKPLNLCINILYITSWLNNCLKVNQTFSLSKTNFNNFKFIIF